MAEPSSEDEKSGNGHSEGLLKENSDGNDADMENDETGSDVSAAQTNQEGKTVGQDKKKKKRKNRNRRQVTGKCSNVSGKSSASESNDRRKVFLRRRKNLIDRCGKANKTNGQTTLRRIRRRRLFVTKLRRLRALESSRRTSFQKEKKAQQDLKQWKTREADGDSSDERDPARKLIRYGSYRSVQQRSGVQRSKSVRRRKSASRNGQDKSPVKADESRKKPKKPLRRLQADQAPTNNFVMEMSDLDLNFGKIGLQDATTPGILGSFSATGNVDNDTDTLLDQLKSLSLNPFQARNERHVSGSLLGQLSSAGMGLSSVKAGNRNPVNTAVNSSSDGPISLYGEASSDESRSSINTQPPDCTIKPIDEPEKIKLTDICQVLNTLQLSPALANIPVLPGAVLHTSDTPEVSNSQAGLHDESLSSAEEEALKPKQDQDQGAQ